VAYIPNQILAPIVAILCFLGAFVAKNYVFDIIDFEQQEIRRLIFRGGRTLELEWSMETHRGS
jgi:TctA family transporter